MDRREWLILARRGRTSRFGRLPGNPYRPYVTDGLPYERKEKTPRPLSERAKMVYNELDEIFERTVAEIVEATGLTRHQVREQLDLLHSRWLTERSTDGRTVWWRKR